MRRPGPVKTRREKDAADAADKQLKEEKTRDEVSGCGESGYGAEDGVRWEAPIC